MQKLVVEEGKCQKCGVKDAVIFNVMFDTCVDCWQLVTHPDV